MSAAVPPVPRARPAVAVVLAAGEGTRMRSATPKVLHRLAGRTLLGHALTAVATLEPEELVVVVGHARELVAAHARECYDRAVPVVQEEQRGTGHAVRVALQGLGRALPEAATVLVTCGDTPLLTRATLHGLLDAHAASGAAVTLLSAELPDPTGYGRVVRGADGAVTAVVEQKDADAATLSLREVNAGVYAFRAGVLATALTRLSTANAQGEEYLTDVVGLAVADGLPVAATRVADPAEILGVNDRVQLAAAGALLRDRLVHRLMLAGVSVVDPATTWVDVDVQCEPDVTLLPGTRLLGHTALQRGATVGPDSTLTDTVVRAGATVRSSTLDGADIGEHATVGPYSYLRPGTHLGRRAKVGAFVETKNAVLGDDSKAPHLAYVGDATVGARSNLGAGTIVVNYDGVDKHRTAIGDDVRVGSNNSLVAPVRVGDGAYTAAGSVIVGDVPGGSLGIARAEQRNVDGWVARRRPARPHGRPAPEHSGPAQTTEREATP